MEPRISVSRSAIRRRPSMRALSTGGFGMAEQPDPNALENGVYTSPQFGSSANDPRRPMDTVGLGMRADAADAEALADREAMDEEERQAGSLGNIDHSSFLRGSQLFSKIVNPQWRLFHQALKDRGVDRLSTGYAAGYDDKPGFFETQSPSMGGLYNASQQQRANYLDAQDTNREAANYQRSRRR